MEDIWLQLLLVAFQVMAGLLLAVIMFVLRGLRADLIRNKDAVEALTKTTNDLRVEIERDFMRKDDFDRRQQREPFDGPDRRGHRR